MATTDGFTKAMHDAGGKDERTPNQKRLDELIEINDDILEEMKLMNKNLAIVGVALIKLAEGKKKVAKV